MKSLFTGLVIGVTTLSSGIASASIASWIGTPEVKIINQEQTVEQPVYTQSINNTQTSKSTEVDSQNPQFTKPTRIEFSQQVPGTNTKVVTKSDAVPTEDTVAQHLAQVSKFINNPGVSSLKTEDYLAVVLLNSALVQLGLDVKLNTNNQTTQNLFKNAVGCINSKSDESLNTIARKLTSDHSKVVDIKQFINSSPSIGSAFTAKCI